MKGGAREGMVIVMPALTKGQQSNHPFVAAPIGSLKSTLAEGVTDGVDAPGHMMGQEDAYQPSPQEARPPTKQKGKQQRESNPHEEGATDKQHYGIGKQVPRIDSRVCFTIFEQPAEMGVEEALHRTMGIAFAISQGMMPGVRGGPL